VQLSVLHLETYALAVGGVRVTEPGADLGIGLAIASSATGRPVPADVVACGEVGLGGELRSVGGLERRLAEAARFGFRRALVPRSTPELAVDLELVRVPTLGAAVALLGLAE
ncbi:MAG: DNA repair protein RadA, partial [Microthrixaceae bacterium]|nr:DNA repair protein RadA [Microthrixaceae bacterium]